MMELLKRFEEEAAEEEDALFKPDTDEEDEEQALIDRLGEVDLGEQWCCFAAVGSKLMSRFREGIL